MFLSKHIFIYNFKPDFLTSCISSGSSFTYSLLISISILNWSSYCCIYSSSFEFLWRVTHVISELSLPHHSCMKVLPVIKVYLLLVLFPLFFVNFLQLLKYPLNQVKQVKSMKHHQWIRWNQWNIISNNNSFSYDTINCFLTIWITNVDWTLVKDGSGFSKTRFQISSR